VNISSLIKATIRHVPVPYMPSNLTLTFKVGTGVFDEDAVGNCVEETTELTISASVRTDKPKPHELDGQIGTNTVLLVGRCIQPKLLPVDINPEQGAFDVLQDTATGQEITGNFRFLPVAQNRFQEVSEHMGTKIRGYLVTIGKV
jgi:hypothetical protein